MVRFNTTKVGTKTVNLVGGDAFKTSDALGLISLLVTSFLKDKYYEDADSNIKRLEGYWDSLKTTASGREYFMKAACYTRDLFKLRSVTHYCAALVGEGVVSNIFTDGEKRLVKRFFSKIVMRPDDITEIISAYKNRKNSYTSKKGKVQLPAVMKKGFSNAMKTYDEYLFAKYRQDNKETSMIDAVRMCHAKHTLRNNDAITKLLYNELKNTTTWQAASSEAGKSGKTQKEVWAEFLNKENVEYFSLLRNLRNILEHSDSDMRKKAASLLTDREHIKKSRILPFRFLQAYTAIEETEFDGKRVIMNALSKAVDIAVDNVPEFDGKTLIIVDVSGSMTGRHHYWTGLSNNPITIAGLFATALYRKNPEADIILYNTSASWFVPNDTDSVITNTEKVLDRCGGGTYMSKAFELFNDKAYDRVILLSDEQTYENPQSNYSTSITDYGYGYNNTANKLWSNYVKKNKNAKLFNLDLAGYGTIQFPENNVFCLAGYSDHVFNIISKLDTDKHYFVNEVKNYVL